MNDWKSVQESPPRIPLILNIRKQSLKFIAFGVRFFILFSGFEKKLTCHAYLILHGWEINETFKITKYKYTRPQILHSCKSSTPRNLAS